MWETIKEIVKSDNFVIVALFLAFALIPIAILIIIGRVRVNLKHIQIGCNQTQRELIRRQVETAYIFIMSLYGKIPDEERGKNFGGYKEKCILEKVYDKVIEWIIFNHITTNQLYVEDKQECICNLVYSMDVDDKYKTPEFKTRMYTWTRELIEKLVQVKEVYA